MIYHDRYGLIELIRYRGPDAIKPMTESAFLLRISRDEPPEIARAIRAIRRHVLAGRWEAAEAHAVALVTGGRPVALGDAVEPLPAAAFAVPGAYGG